MCPRGFTPLGRLPVSVFRCGVTRVRSPLGPGTAQDIYPWARGHRPRRYPSQGRHMVAAVPTSNRVLSPHRSLGSFCPAPSRSIASPPSLTSPSLTRAPPEPPSRSSKHMITAARSMRRTGLLGSLPDARKPASPFTPDDRPYGWSRGAESSTTTSPCSGAALQSIPSRDSPLAPPMPPEGSALTELARASPPTTPCGTARLDSDAIPSRPATASGRRFFILR